MRFLAALFLLGLTAGCLAGQSPSGSGLIPAAPPATSGMAGPAGTEGGMFVGEKPGEPTGVSEVPVGDPTSGNETPMTIVGSPLGSSVKPRPCDGAGFRLCFHGVSVAVKGEGSLGSGQLSYELTGIVATQVSVGSEPEGLLRQDVVLTDLLYPDNQATTSSTKSDVVFRASIDSTPGRVLRLESKYCRRLTVLDLTLPDLGAGSLVVDACASAEPTDTYTPPKPGGPLEAVPFEMDGFRQSR